MRERAKALAAKGFPVFKLVEGGKEPAVGQFYDLASTDSATVNEMWTEALTGDALNNNVGVSMGDGLVALDIDVKNGKRGNESLKALASEGPLPATFTVRSPTGGAHLYYSIASGIILANDASGRLGDGIDIRGHHGYVVGPGSVTENGEYTILNDLPVAPMPDWLIDGIGRHTSTKSTTVTIGEVDKPENIDRAIAYLRNVEPALQGSGGDSHTYKVACRVLDFGISIVTGVELMLDHWNDRCQPPWSPEEIETKLERAQQYRDLPTGVASADEFDVLEPHEYERPKTVKAEQTMANIVPEDLWAENSKPPALSPAFVPSIVWDFAADHSRRLGVEPGALAAAALMTLGSLIPAGNQLQLRQNDPKWTVKPMLWTAIVGAPGTNKSATLGAALAPVDNIDARWRRKFSQEMAAYRAAQPAKAKSAKSQPATIDAGDLPGTMVQRPEPVLRQKIVNDATTEALLTILRDNPQGVLCFHDELTGLFGGMDAYRSSGASKDRPFYLILKEGRSYSSNRKSDRVHAEHCAASILGGIQPEKIRRLARGLSDDGTLQRYIWIMLERQPHGGEDIAADAVLDKAVGELAESLCALPNEDRFKFSSEAAAELDIVEDFKRAEIARPDRSPPFAQWLDKLPNEFGRLALVFHLIEWFTSDDHLVMDFPLPNEIPIETATRARRFLTEFVFHHHLIFYGQMVGGDESETHARWIAGFILARALTEISERDIYRANSDLKGKERRGLITSAMYTLAMLGWVTPVQVSGGAPTKWRVNAAVRDGRFAERADLERSRRDAVRDAIAAKAAEVREARA